MLPMLDEAIQDEAARPPMLDEAIQDEAAYAWEGWTTMGPNHEPWTRLPNLTQLELT